MPGATIPYLEDDDFSAAPAYGSGMQETYTVNRVDFGDGYSQRGKKGINNRKQVWTLQWKAIDDAKAEVLRNFFGDLGGVGLIAWKPYAQPVVLGWTGTDWSGTPSGAGVQDCQITLTQEFDLS